MKLYYSPGACSQAPHILLHEIGLGHDAGGSTSRQDAGGRQLLSRDQSQGCGSGASARQWRGADRERGHPPISRRPRGLAEVLPALGNFRRYRVLELVNYITTELHKSFGFLFHPEASDEMKQLVVGDFGKKLDYIDESSARVRS